MGIRHMDIAFGDVVSFPARNCLEFGKNPDVDELERYNLAAKRAHCTHDERALISDDNWHCQICGSNYVPCPTVEEGTFIHYNYFYLWRRKETNGD